MKEIRTASNIKSFVTNEFSISCNGQILDEEYSTDCVLPNAWYVISREKKLIIDGDQNLYSIQDNSISKLYQGYFVLLNYSTKFIFLFALDGTETLIFSIEKFEIIHKLEDKVVGTILGNFLFSGNRYGDKEITMIQLTQYAAMPNFQLIGLGTWLDGAIEKPYQVLEFSGTFENTLVCTMNSGAILLLDIETGKPKQFFKDAKVRAGVFQIMENSPIFQGLKHYTFVEINAETGELLRQVNIEHELKRVAEIPEQSPCWLTVGTSIYYEGLFYFFGDKNFLGVFDPITEKIIDYHWFEFEQKGTQLKGGVENLQVKGNEIYCLDTANTLHVMERA